MSQLSAGVQAKIANMIQTRAKASSQALAYVARSNILRYKARQPVLPSFNSFLCDRYYNAYYNNFL